MNIYFLNRAKNSLSSSALSACFVLSVCVVFAFLLLCPADATALLSGDASLTYTSFEGSAASASGRTKTSSSSLVQHYSLLYSSNGFIYNSRVGSYDVALGYDYTALDTTIKSSNRNDSYDKSRGHLLYKGEIYIDPKEVPFRLNVFSRDMTRTSVTNSVSDRGAQATGSVLGANLLGVDIKDGMHIESGATLIAGVKNGMTNGYNEILRHFPMILIDFKDVINKDLRSMDPVNDRLSRLAFVSLNKKDNWFHYRHTQFQDYLNTNNNYEENEYQLGTVDQNLARRWVDFSNWLKVSTDIQFSKRKSNYQLNSIEDINLNLFVVGERKYWNARTFTTFNRYKDENNKLTYQTNLPLYASGEINNKTSWNTRTSYRSNNELDVNGAVTKFTSILAGYRVDAFKRSPFTLSQSFDVETSENNASTSVSASSLVTLSGLLETTSTPAFSRNGTLAASYSIKQWSTTIANSNSEFLQQSLSLRAGYALSNTLRFEARQSFSYATGSSASFSSTVRDSSTLLPQYSNPRNFESSSTNSKSFNSVSNLTVAWNPKPRLNISLNLNENIYKSASLGINTITDVQSTVAYTTDVWNFNNILRYTKGSSDMNDNSAEAISNSTTVKYIHSRKLDASGSVMHLVDRAGGSTVRSTSVEQRLNYNYFTRSGVSRKLLEFSETLLIADGSESLNTNIDKSYAKSLFLGLRYFPIQQLSLAGSVGYSFFDRNPFSNNYTLVYNASATANFRLLQASLDYSHGIRKVDGARENRVIGNIRKSF